MKSYGDAPQDLIKIHWFPDISQGVSLEHFMQFMDIQWNIMRVSLREFMEIRWFPDVLQGVSLAKCMNVVEIQWNPNGISFRSSSNSIDFLTFCKGYPLQNVWAALQFNVNLRGYSSDFQRIPLIFWRFARDTPCKMYEFYGSLIKS